MSDIVQRLLALMDLEEIDLDIFRGQNERDRPGRLFGGQVAAQALVAAQRTVTGRAAHSLHGYFLRPGDPAHPVIYTVDRIRDGQSFTTRRVVAAQRGKAIFNMSVSFQVAEQSYEHQAPMPEAPPPEDVPGWSEIIEANWERIPEESRAWAPRPRPIELRPVLAPTFLGGEPSQEGNRVWFRVPEPVGDEFALHQQLLAYASDMALLDNIVRPHGRNGPLG
ncbi:MAG: thioesterase family protein, partial [Myxococcota bacterium]|nr:thioesterase family protein [Myxococcota bacterium]